MNAHRASWRGFRQSAGAMSTVWSACRDVGHIRQSAPSVGEAATMSTPAKRPAGVRQSSVPAGFG